MPSVYRSHDQTWDRAGKHRGDMGRTNQRNTGGGGQAVDELIGRFGYFLWVDPAQALKERDGVQRTGGGRGERRSSRN